MIRTNRTSRTMALVAGTALASMALAGCTTKAAPRADLSASQAELALKKGKADKAIEHAEAAVLADGRNPAYRATLGSAYLEAGRFTSAMISFDDAMKLGDTSPRTALSYALAASAAGQQQSARAVLIDWRDSIPAADMGLAMALAGDPNQGVQILANAIRSGDNTPKTRQNLAYAYALAGNWQAARLMAGQDVPGDQLNARMTKWAAMARPEDASIRVATLLGTKADATDPGQPVQLALGNHPNAEQLAAEAAAYAAPEPQAAPAAMLAHNGGELPALNQTAATPRPAPVASVAQASVAAAPAAHAPTTAASQPAPALAVAEPQATQPRTFEAAFATRAPDGASAPQMMKSAIDFASKPVVQRAPARYGAVAPKPQAERIANRTAKLGTGSHLIQLGSFLSEQGARRAWGVYAKQYPELSNYDMVITEAKIRGKRYYRVSAGGFASAGANSMCSTMKARGQGCFKWAEGKPLPGAVDSGIRMASR